MFEDPGLNSESGLGIQAQSAFCSGNLRGGEGLPVGFGQTLHGGSSLGHGALSDDEQGTMALCLGGPFHRLPQFMVVVPIDFENLPLHGFKVSLEVQGTDPIYGSRNLNIVFVVIKNQIAQTPMPGQLAGPQRHIFLQITIPRQNPNSRQSIQGAQGLFLQGSNGHTDTHGDPLAQGAGGGFNTRRQMTFGMTRG